ncbi:MAG: DNA/RNA nuclease SfsA [Boseongicola sp.]
MLFPTPLVPARLLRRYKRFLADVEIEASGEKVTAHCPNPGAMIGLAEPGTRIWLEPNDDPKKKLKFGWRLAELKGGHLAGIDTSVPNQVVGEALRGGKVQEFSEYTQVNAEVPYGEKSRVDFVLSAPGHREVYLEVKNVHLKRTEDLAEFPDCVTLRGARHLHELASMVAHGHRAVMLYLVQRSDCARFTLASDLDPGYADAFRKADAAGVEAMCFGTEITTEGVQFGAALPIED